MTIILLDVDNTICDFTGAVCREASKVLEREINPLEVTQWNLRASLEMNQKQTQVLYKIIQQRGFCLGLEPLPGAVSAVKKLQSLGAVNFVTSPWNSSPYWMWERTKWLRTFFDAYPDEVIHTHQKWLVKGDVIIDDRPVNVISGERKLRILIPTPANKHWRNNNGVTLSDPVYVSKSWPSIIREVKELVQHG